MSPIGQSPTFPDSLISNKIMNGVWSRNIMWVSTSIRFFSTST